MISNKRVIRTPLSVVDLAKQQVNTLLNDSKFRYSFCVAMTHNIVVLRSALLVVTLGLPLLGCAPVGQNYRAPTIELENTFLEHANDNLVEAAYNNWWSELNDPILNNLILRGFDKNLDIMNTYERIVMAEAVLKQSSHSAQLSGSLVGQGNASRDSGVRTFAGGLQGSYVLDLFGGRSRQEEQAAAQLDAATLTSGNVRLGFLAELTSAYVIARHLQEALLITDTRISNQTKVLDRVRQLQDVGQVTELDVKLAEAELMTLQASRPQFEASFDSQIFRIATLLAEPSQRIFTELQLASPVRLPNTVVVSGVPSDLLRNRPDIRANERTLAATTSGIGIAKSELYPTLTLSGTLGLDGNLAVASNIVAPLLNRRSLVANVRVAEARTQEVENLWRKSVLLAAEEVNASLSQLAALNQQRIALSGSISAHTSVYELTIAQFRVGKATITDVLIAESSLSNARLSVARTEKDFVLSWIALHIRTGQGWLSHSPLPSEANETALLH